jgi:hypothetical protein
LTLQVAELPVGVPRLHEVGLKPPDAAPFEKLTIPVGAVEAPVTVAVHEVDDPTVTELGRQDTLVVVD